MNTENNRSNTPTPAQADSSMREGRHHFDKQEDIKRYTLSDEEIAALKKFPRMLNERVIKIVEGNVNGVKKINAAMLHRRMPKYFSGSGVFTRIRKKIQLQLEQEEKRKDGLEEDEKTLPNVGDVSLFMMAYFFLVVGPGVFSIDKILCECLGELLPRRHPTQKLVAPELKLVAPELHNRCRNFDSSVHPKKQKKW